MHICRENIGRHTSAISNADVRPQPRLLQMEGVLLARPGAELRRLARARRCARLRLARRALRLALQPALLHLRTVTTSWTKLMLY